MTIEKSKVFISDHPEEERQKDTHEDKTNMKMYSEAVKQDNQMSYYPESGKIHFSNMLLSYCQVIITLGLY